jgi:hypothetical protein
MISFRVSEREFEMLKTVSETEGHRSVSDFARLTLCGRSNGHETSHDRTAGHDGIDLLRNDLDELKKDLRRVAEMLEQEQPKAAEVPGWRSFKARRRGAE